MKSYLITTVAAFLAIFLGVSAKGDQLSNVTTLDVPGGSYTEANGIDGSNIVGRYETGGNPLSPNFAVLGFSMTAPPKPRLMWMCPEHGIPPPRQQHAEGQEGEGGGFGDDGQGAARDLKADHVCL